MAKRRKGKRSDRELSMDGLITEIGRVNPTGRGLPRGEETRRYAQKTALQAALIERFADHLHVEVGPDPDVVLLRLTSGKDAAHCVLSSLPDDARAWVRLQLDLQESALQGSAAYERSPRPSKPFAIDTADTTDTPDDSLSAGLEALAAYDYEGAQRHLQRALRDQPTIEAALALLDLFVDHLAADADALDLEARLSASMRAHLGIRSRLALAAARSGASGAAKRLVGLDGERATEAWRLIARSRIAQAQLDGATDAVEHLRALDPAHPAAADLDAAISAARTDLRRPAEAALKQLMASEAAPDTLEAEARSLLDRWPASVVARQALSAVEAKRRKIEVQDLLDRGHAARDAGATDSAINLLSRARSLGADVADLDALIEASKKDRDAAAIQDVERRLCRDLKSGLAAYLSLEGRLQPAVNCEGPELSWLKALDTSTAHRTRRAIDAVFALRSALDLPDVIEAEPLLNGFHDELKPLSEYAQFTDRLELAKQTLLTQRAEDRGCAVRAALASGQLHDAMQAVAKADPERSILTGLRRMSHLAATALDPNALDALAPSQTLLSVATAFVDELTSHRARIDESIQRRFCVHTVELSGPFRWKDWPAARCDSDCWLLPGGDTLVLPAIHDRWALFRQIDTHTGALICATTLRLPDPGQELFDFVAGPSEWRLTTGAGWVLTLSPDGRRVRGWRRVYRETSGRDLECATLTLGHEIWYNHCSLRGDESKSTCVDESDGRVLRTIDELFPKRVLGDPEGRMLLTHLDYTSAITNATGTGRSCTRDRGCSAESALAVAGTTELAFIASRDADEAPVYLETPSGFRLDLGFSRWQGYSLGCARDQGLVFVLQSEALTAIAMSHDHAEVCWRVDIGGRAELTADRHGTAAVLLRTKNGVPQPPIHLGPSAPPTFAEPRAEWLRSFSLAHCEVDTRFGPVESSFQQNSEAAIESTAAGELAGLVDNFLRQEDKRVEDFIALIVKAEGPSHISAPLKNQTLASRLIRIGAERFPDSEDLQWRAALGYCEIFDFRAALKCLSRTVDWSETRRQHRAHLTARCLVAIGDLEGAREALNRATAITGACDLDGTDGLLRELEGAPEAIVSTGARSIHALHAATSSPSQALELLNIPSVIDANHSGPVTALAAAWLEVEPTDPVGRIEKYLALGRAVADNRFFDEFPFEAPSPERAREVREAATAWLEADAASTGGLQSEPASNG